MSKFICDNSTCPKFGVEDEYLTNTYKVVGEKLQSNHAHCPNCAEIRREVNMNKDIPLSEKHISVAKYSSASKEERTNILKKRSHEHFKKTVQPFKEHQLHEAVKNFKGASKN